MSFAIRLSAVCLAVLVLVGCGESDGARSDGVREGDGGECGRFSSDHGGDDTRIHTREELEELHRSRCTDVPGALRIFYVPGVKDLRLVEHIESARIIEISHTTDLETLDGLENITGVQLVNLTQNDALTDTSALPSPTGQRRFRRFKSLVVHHNDKIQKLEGLEGLSHVGHSISIIPNQRLEEIAGFDSLTSFDGPYIEIYDNPQLPQCEIQRMLDRLTIEYPDDTDIWIENNDTAATCE